MIAPAFCPTCNVPPMIIFILGEWIVKCKVCQKRITGKSKESAVKYWNGDK